MHALSQGNWQQSFTRNDSLGAQKYGAARFLADWTPADALHISLNLNGSNDTFDPQAYQLIVVIPSEPTAPSAAELATPLSRNNDAITGLAGMPATYG
jgi:hypothetical protein